MFDDLAAYYHENVVSAYIDYRDIKGSGTAGRSQDIRNGIIAAEALFRLREHIPAPHQLSRAATERECPEYGLLGDIVNAAKHKRISQKTPHGSPLLHKAEQIKELIVLTEYQDEDGPYRFAEKTVIVKLSDGSFRNLFEVLTIVINYWENFLHSLGILSCVRTFSDGCTNKPKNRKEWEQNRLDFEIVKGLRFHQTILMQRFNYQTGKVEPVDLTGSQAKFNIYKPNHVLDLSLKHDKSGKEFKKTISLSEDEYIALLDLKTDEERQNYIKSLPSAKKAWQQLVLEAGIISHSNNLSEKNT